MFSSLTVAGVALCALSSISLSIAAPAIYPRKDCGPNYCQGTWQNDTNYFCGDTRLGPVVLPTKLPLGTILAEYHRLGGLCPGEFIKKWWSDAKRDWIYPDDDGFQLDISSKPIKGQQELPVGLLIDRFGYESGKFLAPADSPYTQRSLPPRNLDTPTTDPTYPNNYHVYKVIKSFVVFSGPVAPHFGQPGQGTQYQSSVNVSTLIKNLNLEHVNIHDKDSSKRFEKEVEEQRRRRRSLELDV